MIPCCQVIAILLPLPILGDPASHPTGFLPPTLRAQLRGERSRISSLAISPNGKVLAANCSNTIVCWDMGATKKKVLLRTPKYTSSVLAFSPDSRTLASATSDKVVRLWEMETHQQRTAFRVPYRAKVLTYCPSGKCIAIGFDSDKTPLQLVDATSGKVIAVIRGLVGSVMSLVFSPDGKLLASGGDDGTIHIWDVDTIKTKLILNGHTGFVNSVAFSPDGKALASGSDDKTIRVWRVRDGEALAVLTTKQFVTFVAFTPSGNVLASGGTHDGKVRLWSTRGYKLLQTFNSQLPCIDYGLFNLATQSLAVCGGGSVMDDPGEVTVWELVEQATKGRNRSRYRK